MKPMPQNLWGKTGEMAFCFKEIYDLLWEKNVLLIKTISWNSGVKAKNLPKNCDHLRIYSKSERLEVRTIL